MQVTVTLPSRTVKRPMKWEYCKSSHFLSWTGLNTILDNGYHVEGIDSKIVHTICCNQSVFVLDRVLVVSVGLPFHITIPHICLCFNILCETIINTKLSDSCYGGYYLDTDSICQECPEGGCPGGKFILVVWVSFPCFCVTQWQMKYSYCRIITLSAAT